MAPRCPRSRDLITLWYTRYQGIYNMYVVSLIFIFSSASSGLFLLCLLPSSWWCVLLPCFFRRICTRLFVHGLLCVLWFIFANFLLCGTPHQPLMMHVKVGHPSCIIAHAATWSSRPYFTRNIKKKIRKCRAKKRPVEVYKLLSQQFQHHNLSKYPENIK